MVDLKIEGFCFSFFFIPQEIEFTSQIEIDQGIFD